MKKSKDYKDSYKELYDEYRKEKEEYENLSNEKKIEKGNAWLNERRKN